MEVEADGSEECVDPAAGVGFEVIAAHAVLGFEMADDGLDGGAALPSREPSDMKSLFFLLSLVLTVSLRRGPPFAADRFRRDYGDFVGDG